MAREFSLSGKYDTSAYDQDVLRWTDVVNHAKVLPEYDADTLLIMRNFIGYLPPEYIYFPHQVFVRSALANFHAGVLTRDEFVKEAEIHSKHIRNDDMKKHGYTDRKEFDEDDYRMYNSYLPQFTGLAKERLAEIVGYEPELEYSLSAEIYLRQLFLSEIYHKDMYYTLYDMRATTIYGYRTYLTYANMQQADDSRIVGLSAALQSGCTQEDLMTLPIFK